MSGSAPKQDAVRIRFPCVSCGRTLKARPQLVGRTVRCPHCGGSSRVPSADAVGSSTSGLSVGTLDVPTQFDDGSTAADPKERVRFPCGNCHRMLKVHPSARGQRVRCPKCGTSQRVPLEIPPSDSKTDAVSVDASRTIVPTSSSPSSPTVVDSQSTTDPEPNDVEHRVPVVRSPVETLDFEQLAQVSGERNSLVRPVQPHLTWRQGGWFASALARRLITLAGGVAAFCVTAFVVLLVLDSMRGIPASSGASENEANETALETDRAVTDAAVSVVVFDRSGEPIGSTTGYLVDASGVIAVGRRAIARGARTQVEFRDGRRFDVINYRHTNENPDVLLLRIETAPQHIEPVPLDRVLDRLTLRSDTL